MAAAAAPPAAPAATWPDVLSTPELQERIRTAKVLAVGAGGIGCELLKTLVLSGFEDIEVVDLDTIETSNLNRQFLFRKHHVGKSKAEVAAEVVSGFAPRAKINAHQANIKEARFGLDFIRSKDVVLNGLDNLDARRHVNRLCVAAGTPLVTVHLKGVTECYECTHRGSQQRTYPVCTLRNTPDKPIHCIVWAKDMLFARLFGRPEAVTDLDDQAAAAAKPGRDAALAPPASDSDAREQDQRAASEAAEAASFFLRREGEGAGAYAGRVFGRAFGEDVEKVARMEELWKSRRAPTPLRLAEVLPGDAAAAAAAAGAAAGAGGGVARALGLGDHDVWSDADAARVFLASVVAFLEHRPSEVGAAVFDKGMAGNIIHAVATTNAIVSGLLVTEAIKVLAGLPQECATSFIYERAVWSGRKKAPVGALVAAAACPPPRPGCMVVRSRLAVNEPSLIAGNFMYEEGGDLSDSEVDFNARKLGEKMAALPGGGLGHGAVVSVRDQSQQFVVEVIVNHRDDLSEEQHPEGFVLEGQLPAQQQAEGQGQDGQQQGEGQQRESGAAPGAAAAAAAAAGGKKRARGGGGGGDGHGDGADGAKRARAGAAADAAAPAAGGGGDDGPIVIDDDEDVL
ncbi:SUMO-activating enzyme subunit 2 [Raphidocelis subcapitata]|uniref:SUMO-activating enzyme subunit 2 n=1 Tax=Raphidocelis subcapitata TaxID=307507 RepID=A0A2V0PCL6_9CHLO|nr:SUMO-activating enzyme subunit 2 [Raphidocelis subcapitata]|eukprot:GBF97588.1 SUMO-activating enzyme subunit 2 [Raphidocelis subcapitata]